MHRHITKIFFPDASSPVSYANFQCLSENSLHKWWVENSFDDTWLFGSASDNVFTIQAFPL